MLDQDDLRTVLDTVRLLETCVETLQSTALDAERETQQLRHRIDALESAPRLVMAWRASVNMSCDGRGKSNVVGYFVDASPALASVRGKEPYGNDGMVARLLVAVDPEGNVYELGAATGLTLTEGK